MNCVHRASASEKGTPVSPGPDGASCAIRRCNALPGAPPFISTAASSVIRWPCFGSGPVVLIATATRRIFPSLDRRSVPEPEDVALLHERVEPALKEYIQPRVNLKVGRFAQLDVCH